MKSKIFVFITLMIIGLSCESSRSPENAVPGNLYEYSENIEPRWVSFENITGAKGLGGTENFSAKGHPSDRINAGEIKTIFDIEGPGIINRIWITIVDRSPQMLRGLIINFYWDNEKKPAVSVPFGDFFGVGLGETAAFENAIFANPEGRSFNSFIQMPFKTAAKIQIVNESGKDLRLIFYDVNLQLLKIWDEKYLYFHSFWHRDTATALAEDFEILPEVEGKGRFLGTNISVISNPNYNHSWWGEGEAKIYINGDKEYPTLIGTGTEDYIGTGWGQGQYFHRFNGCSVADKENDRWAFYRYHIPDPVYFKTGCRVTIQQMGGDMKKKVAQMQKAGTKLIPVTIGTKEKLHHIYKPGEVVNLEDPDLPDGWTNFYRSDDVAAVAYFYLDKPGNNLPGIQQAEIRTFNLKEN